MYTIEDIMFKVNQYSRLSNEDLCTINEIVTNFQPKPCDVFAGRLANLEAELKKDDLRSVWETKGINEALFSLGEDLLDFLAQRLFATILGYEERFIQTVFSRPIVTN